MSTATRCRVFVINDSGESHWMSAPSAGEALRIWIVDYNGMDGLEDGAELQVYKLADETMLKIASDDGSPTINQPASEWAKEGPGMVGSTVW